jgi:hypothetical protein
LDDGEVPVEVNRQCREPKSPLFQANFPLEDGKVVYKNNSIKPDYKQAQVGTPDYSDLLLDKYISVIEIVNPMHHVE